MSMLNESAETALKKAMEREDVKKVLGKMLEDMIPTIAYIISAMLEEMNGTDEQAE